MRFQIVDWPEPNCSLGLQHCLVGLFRHVDWLGAHAGHDGASQCLVCFSGISAGQYSSIKVLCVWFSRSFCGGRFRRYAGIGLAAVDLHGAGLFIPPDVEANCLTDIPQLQVIVSVDQVGLEMGLFPIDEDML